MLEVLNLVAMYGDVSPEIGVVDEGLPVFADESAVAAVDGDEEGEDEGDDLAGDFVEHARCG